MSFDASGAAADIELELRALGTPQRAGGEKAYLKSDLDFLGTTVPDIRRVAKGSSKSTPALRTTTSCQSSKSCGPRRSTNAA